MVDFDDLMPDGFPAGLRVLAVDDDSFALKTLELILLNCGYKVTVSHQACQALDLLRANRGEYDIMIIEANLPDMNGFQLLEMVGIEMDLPVIMISVDSDFKSVIKAIQYGAVDYLVKPVRLEEIKLIWKHVAKKSLNEKMDVNDSRSNDVQISMLTKKSKRDRDEDDNINSENNLTSQKRARVTWTPKLHAKFINAVNQLGIDRAVPKKILDIMEIPGLTRENVASHLQKYRKGFKRNTIELGQKINDNAEIRGHSGCSFPMTINRPNSNLYKSYQSIKPSINQLDCQMQSTQSLWISDGYTRPNSVPQLGSIVDQQATNILLNNNFDELASFYTIEEQQHISSSSGANIELERQIYMDSVDDQSYNFEDHKKSNASDLTVFSEEYLSTETFEKLYGFDNLDYTDDLHVALIQFQY